jgi:hypothetical protein
MFYMSLYVRFTSIALHSLCYTLIYPRFAHSLPDCRGRLQAHSMILPAAYDRTSEIAS